jgi:hypothetical protein
MTYFITEQFRVLKDGDRFFFTHSKGENAKGLPENLQVQNNKAFVKFKEMKDKP